MSTPDPVAPGPPPGRGAALGPRGVFSDADRARHRRYAEAAAFAAGDQWPGRARRGEVRLTVNYARALTRKVASYVFAGPVTFGVPAEARLAEAASRAELALAEVVSANDLDWLDAELCTRASVLGDAAAKVTWDPRTSAPVVTAVDPGTLSVRTAADRPRLIREVTQVYALAPDEAEALFGASDATRLLAGDRAATVVETWTDDRWRVSLGGRAVRDEPNPYGWIPYVIAANDPEPDGVWGRSDLDGLIDICRELNARLSVLSHVLELSGAPVAVLEGVDGSEGIAIGPGAKWELPEGSRAYLLDLLAGGGIRLHIDYVELLYRAMHDLSETPRTAFGDAGRTLSGAALEVEIQPLVQKVQRKRRLWEAFHRARNERLLDLLERFGGQELGGLRRTVTTWPSILPSDTDAAVRNAVSLVGSGIQSRRTAYAALGGLDPEQELATVVAEAALLGGGGRGDAQDGGDERQGGFE